ncbi:MICOS complex subunit MIC19 [Liparis tanakae]|uniref:MICOS complex subunit MIC19 n=1 Tax=Liparis tanakae TaxID=230148 RepID=A0A4Z2G7A9_9TELE|nr:MICOS complex subunit MIC19 [Liparis tanakae]
MAREPERYEASPVCADLQGQILACYKDNVGKTLNCSNIAALYLQCVNNTKQIQSSEAASGDARRMAEHGKSRVRPRRPAGSSPSAPVGEALALSLSAACHLSPDEQREAPNGSSGHRDSIRRSYWAESN